MIPLTVIYVLLVTGYFIYLQRIPKDLTIEGQIDGCCCSAQLLKDTNNQIFDSLQTLVVNSFIHSGDTILQNLQSCVGKGVSILGPDHYVQIQIKVCCMYM